ncbi:MAG: AAA family ATPase [Tabrizicola flagellatus]|uniref:AAA family ATPase n=1 Tax=Tabrizicola flagellatus TaxID=2593021 RepID=UPI0039199180
MADIDLTRAALIGAYDPRVLLGPTPEDGAARLQALAAVSTEVQVGETWLWRLTPDAQRDGLARLPAGAARRALLAGLPEAGDDALARSLRLLLAGGRAAPAIARPRRIRPKEEDLPALLSLLQALELLRNAKVELEGWAADPDLARRLARLAVQSDKLAASRQILGWKLRGRRAELSALADFAATGRIRIPPLVLPDAPVATASSAPPTVILSGLGGSGKSALLEALRRRLGRDRSILRVVFDLDQPALRAGHRVALTQELLRQVGEQRADLDERLSAIRQTLRGGVAAGSETVDPGREASAVVASLTALNEILTEEGGDAPIRLVLIFDTFEEALIVGEYRVGLIADWIALVGRQRLVPRVILSGREAGTIPPAHLPGLAVQGVLPLGDLGTQAGRALLRDQFRSRSVEGIDLVPRLVEVFGSDPLTLMMIARFAESLGREGRDVEAELTALVQDGPSEARGRLDGELRQAFLFSRILDRLPTRELQAVASPGLVLREVTPELIREVLAGPCGLKVDLTGVEAKALFDKLAEMVWLVRPVSGAPDRVEHLPDLRRRMLPQILQDPRAKAVAGAAAAWFEARAALGEPGADLDAVYYRALADPASLPREPDLLRRLADHLGVFVDDLDFARDRFRDARGRVVSRKAVETLARGAVQRGARDRRQKVQMSEGQERAAIEEAVGAEPPDDTAMSAEQVSLRFAELNLALVAGEAPRLARLLLDAIPGTAAPLSPQGEMTAEDLQGLSVAALQAATACHAPDLGPDPAAGLRAAVRDWLEDPERRERLRWVFANAAEQSGQLWPARLALVLVLSLAGSVASAEMGETLWQGVRAMARLSHSPFAWRSLRLAGPLPEDAAIKGIALAYLAPEVMNFVAGEFRDWAERTVPDALRREELLKVFVPFFEAPSRVSIRDHNAVDAMLYREDFTVKERLPLFGRLPATMPGRLPEFHGAFRVILGGDDLAPVLVQEAVAALARFVPWWPGELMPEVFAEAPYSPTLVASLIDTADRCGRLPDLAAALARQAGAPAGCGRLSALIEATVNHYRRAAEAGLTGG